MGYIQRQLGDGGSTKETVKQGKVTEKRNNDRITVGNWDKWLNKYN